MKTIQQLMLSAFLLPALCMAQVKPGPMKKVAYGLYFLYFDTTAAKHSLTKSTLVEFKEYTALIEVPLFNQGSDAGKLSDHPEEGKAVLELVQQHFAKKPLKYIFSSHWHPHSLSAMKPFLSSGVTIVSTVSNCKKLQEMLDSTDRIRYKKQLLLVEGDSLRLGDRTNSIVSYRLEKKQYTSIPTEDYLFFYLPRYDYLHSSCMVSRAKGWKVEGKELVTGRLENIGVFTAAKGLQPKEFLSYSVYNDDVKGLVPGDTLRKVLQEGICASALEKAYLALPEEVLSARIDSLADDVLQKNLPSMVLNNAVYRALDKKQLRKALHLARLNALCNPSDPNAWDTLGETYYFLEEKELAKHYEQQSRRINKEYSSGGEKVWQEDLEKYQAQWGVSE